MNSLALRISNAGGKKSKTSKKFQKLDVSQYFPQELLATNEVFRTFYNAETADEQLAALKPILDEESSTHGTKGECSVQSIQFLVKLFFNAEAKHPVKYFLTRNITKNSFFHLQFSEVLSKEIKSYISIKPETYKEYVGILTKISSCIENFTSGVAAVKIIELDVAHYLEDCLRCCVETLRSTQSLSPTEKNEIYNLAHLSLRLFLHIVQKVSPENVQDLTSLFNAVRLSIRELWLDGDAPMDTKSVCGMLYLNMHILENGPDSWTDILQSSPPDHITTLLLNAPSQLSLYAAVATVVPAARLHSRRVDDEPALLVLCNNILALGERSSSEPVFTLGVTRALVQITKQLDKMAGAPGGPALVASLLGFVWTHLDHYMDSVRHLAQQILANIVKYCSKLDKEGDPEALNALFEALTTFLDHNRKSYYVCLTALASELGASKVLGRLPSSGGDVIRAISQPHVRASATTALETLLTLHVREADAKTVYEQWVGGVLACVGEQELDCSALAALGRLLAGAVQQSHDLHDYIVPHIKQSNSREANQTRILSLSVIVETPKTTLAFSREELNFILWFLKYNINAQSPNFRQLMLSLLKRFIKRLEDSHRVLKKQKEFTEDYYVQFLEELRIFCFESLIQGANYSRRVVALQILVWCEQLNLVGYEKVWIEDYVERLLMHLEDSYENNKAFALEILNNCPTEFITCKKYSTSLELDDILKQASSLKPTDCVSAAYKLQLLTNKLPDRIVPDSACNANVTARVSFTLLQVLHSKLLVELEQCERGIASAAGHAPMYGVLHCMRRILAGPSPQEICSDQSWSALISDILAASARATAAVACIVNNSSPEGHLPCDMGGVSDHGNTGGLLLEDGRQVTAQMVLLCAWRSVKEVSLLLGEISSRFLIVGEDSPLGTLTPDQLVSIGEHFTKLLAETKHRGAFEQAYVGFTKLLARLWRCKLGSLHSLPATWLQGLLGAVRAGGGALCVTRRGAGLPFMIQALVTTELQVLGNPKCFHQCMSTLLSLARAPAPPEQQSETAIETRTHALNILRALFRNSSLDESVAGYVGEGLMVALEGFEGGTWMERNSSTLLFSALMVRVFGVARTRHADYPCVRNRMTGRIFFLRYPQLYDFMLDKLKEVNDADDDHLLRPALYPILLLLARLYPSSLEGTVSNLKLSAFVPLVLARAASRALRARQLAATAVLPLIPPEHYLQHFETLLGYLGDWDIKMNHCHGILLQLTRLLSASNPDGAGSSALHSAIHSALLAKDGAALARVSRALLRSQWLLEHGPRPCYTVQDEYIKMINLIVWRFPILIDKNASECIQMYLENLIFSENTSPVNSGRDICLSNALYLYYILIIKRTDIVKIYDLLYKTLSHQSYEVVLTTLNFFLILCENLEIENLFQEHIDEILNKHGKTIQLAEQLHEYTHLLCEVVKRNRYFECQQKALKILSLQKNTEKYIVQTKLKKKGVRLNDDIVINTLIECINTEHENLSPIYLACLSNYITSVLDGNKEAVIKPNLMLNTLRAMLACCRADCSDEARSVVVGFVETNVEELFMMGLNGLSKEAKFEFKATIYSILVTMLEDYDEILRQRTSNIINKLQDIFPNATKFRSTSFLNVDEAIFGSPSNNVTVFRKLTRQGSCHELPVYASSESSNTNAASKVVSSKTAEVLRELIARNEEQNIAIFVVLALLDFKSEVIMNDEINDECRVFDQNERYNIYLEETVWTKEIAEHITEIAQQTNTQAISLVLTVLNNQILRKPIHKLCNDNLVLFEKLLSGEGEKDVTQINPKIELFIRKLKK